MKKLILKEFKLALHPTVYIFWLLSAMLLIPNYPYYVIFFYTTLGLFFVCLNGRESHDIEYSLSLPIRKRDVVRGRMAFGVIVELIQFALAVPFTILRNAIEPTGNAAGMDANISLFALSLIMLGIFNYSFFTQYYKDPAKVGRTFAISSVLVFLFIVLAETCVHILPLMKDVLDTPDPQYLMAKLAALGVGIIVFALLTAGAYKKSVSSFETLDM